MARYINEIKFNGNSNETFVKIHTNLLSQGFEYINYDGENVFKKGQGVLVAPTFLKVSFLNGIARVEAWIKVAILPGVYLGEYGMTGFVGMAAKGTMKKAVSHVETILNSSNSTFDNNDVEYISEPQKDINKNFCDKCGSHITDGYKFCTECGSPITVNQSISEEKIISRKEFIENIAPASIKKSIKTIAVLLYICAGLTFFAAIAIDPVGIIDAVVYLILALGMHLRKSCAFAIALLVLSCFEVLVSLIASGSLAGIAELIISIYAVVTFNKVNKLFKEYTNN